MFCRPRRLLLPALLTLCGLSLGTLAQSPTADFLRIQNLRSGTPPPRVTVMHSQLVSRGGYIRSRATVTAPTRELARRYATRHAYARAVRVVTYPSRRLQAMSDTLAAATSELKAIHALIVSEKKTDTGYAVEVEVNQSEAALAQDIRSVGLSNFRLVALLPENIDGVRVSSPTVETALVGVLADKQFQVYDWNYVAAQRPLAQLVAATLSGQCEAAGQLGTRFLANVIIAGRVDARFSQENGGIVSYLATANLRVLRVDTGQILIAKDYREKGFGQDRAQAAREALTALAQTVSSDLPANLLAHTEERPATIRMVSAPGPVADQTAQYLRSLPGVTRVEQSQAGPDAVFHVTSRENPAALGAWIAQSPDYQLLNVGQTSTP